MGDICTHKTIQFVCGFFYMCKSNLQMPQKIRLRRMTGPYFLRHLETGQICPASMPRGSAPIIPRGSAFRICRWQIHGNNTVTDIYIRYDYKNVDRANRNIIDFVNSDEEEY